MRNLTIKAAFYKQSSRGVRRRRETRYQTSVNELVYMDDGDLYAHYFFS